MQSLWKNSYRLTKVFAHPDFIGPMRAAVSIKGRLEKFKVNMPIIQALCNPGLKGRHWALMSKKVSTFCLQPSTCAYHSSSSGTSLRLASLQHLGHYRYGVIVIRISPLSILEKRKSQFDSTKFDSTQQSHALQLLLRIERNLIELYFFAFRIEPLKPYIW